MSKQSDVSIGAAVYEFIDARLIGFLQNRIAAEKTTLYFCMKTTDVSDRHLKELIEQFAGMFSEKIIVSQMEGSTMIRVGDELFARVDDRNTSFRTVRMYASDSVIEQFKTKYADLDTMTVEWFFVGRRGSVDSIEIELPTTEHAKDEHYPFIEGGLDRFFADYIKSSSSILLLMGPPGTGKTSLVRELIRRQKMHAAISYDPKILTSDNFFVEFMTREDYNLLVMEDADILLGSREVDQNPDMNRFLNVGDGLIKMPHKKMVFSTNIIDESRIDPALIREGRCFDIVRFRNLSRDEALKVAAVNDIELVEDKSQFALSEIFARKKNQIERRRMGF